MPRPHAHHHPIFPPLPQTFITKKARILDSLSVPLDTYTDKSPKGSVDAPIVDLIDEINAIDGLVTTSSCSGRIAVFVEGQTVSVLRSSGEGTNGDQPPDDGGETIDGEEQDPKAITGSPAGKGSGKWLYVSHEPASIPQSPARGFFMNLCGLSDPVGPSRLSSVISREHTSTADAGTRFIPRLVKLSFSPLILHIHCATLAHAKPLLAAAINAGFRESGVQSLKAVDDAEAGVTLGIRTAGLGFETVVGVVCELGSQGGGAGDGGDEENYESVVSEQYLACMFEVVNGRFKWNERRRERLRAEIRKGFVAGGNWEDGEARRRRKREEGLRRRREGMNVAKDEEGDEVEDSVIGAELALEVNGMSSLFEENGT